MSSSSPEAGEGKEMTVASRNRPEPRKSMRKRILPSVKSHPTSAEEEWLDVSELGEVELTSEDPAHPIESALLPGGGPGWRAAEPGAQVIRLRFVEPQDLRRIRLVFEEHHAARTQEFVLRWSGARGEPHRDLIRQQYNFSPPGTTREIEEFEVELEGVASLELSIVPDLAGGEHRASLAEWRLR